MRDLSRRDFLACGAASIAGLGFAPLARAAVPDAEAPGVRGFRELGKTGMKISDVSFGASRLRGDEDLVRHAFDRGINYFDTAETYTGGASETTIGNALKGKRDRVYLTSKTETTGTTSRAEMMRALEGSLRRLQTDHVDVYFNHAVNDVARLSNPEWPEFVAEAKQQGKIRFAGMSGHAGKLIECLDYAIDHKLVDVVLVAYNFGQDPAFYQKLLGGFDMDCGPDRPAARGSQGEGSRRRRRRHEDAHGRPVERHASVREAGRHVRAVGVSLGALQLRRGRADRLDDERGTGRRVPRCFGVEDRRGGGARAPGALRRDQLVDHLPVRLRRV